MINKYHWGKAGFLFLCSLFSHNVFNIYESAELRCKRGPPLLNLFSLQVFSFGITLVLPTLLLSFIQLLDSGHPAVKHQIKLSDPTPFKQRPRPIHPQDFDAVRKHLQELLDSGVIRESDSPFASPIVVARKKNGSVRLCIDYRKLNLQTIKDAYALPKLEDTFSALAGSKWFTIQDAWDPVVYVVVQSMDKEGRVYKIRPRDRSGPEKNLNRAELRFEEEMVDICLKILDANLKYRKDPAGDTSAHCNPVYVSRVISAMINSNNDQGVLVGRWDGNYSDGCSPTYWTSSISILQCWFKNRCNPVKYGQCWTSFDLIILLSVISVMQFFGIPCRVVTNFQSAHDSNNSLTIDEYYDDYGIRNKETSESVWNFHVWVEGWMKRPDLMKGGIYDGWQVLDPTPQEKSESDFAFAAPGVFCCGPAPVKAILRGDTAVKYDVPFVYAEVNAGIVKWMISPEGSKKKMYTDSMSVGQSISTKAVGSHERVDITNSYKHSEGSTEERAIFKRAVRMNSKEGHRCDIEEAPQKIQMKIEEETKAINGQDIKLRLKLSRKDQIKKLSVLHVNAQVMRYNGNPAGNILKKQQSLLLLFGHGLQLLSHNFVLEPVRVNREMTLEVEFKNPLNERLRNCSLTVTGRGLFKSDYIRSDKRELERNAMLTVEITTTPYRVGLKTVVANFDCSSFRDIKSFCIVEVKP
ncbi:hypothetical protein ACER0C_001793 [Sarotherodon galilaeus]